MQKGGLALRTVPICCAPWDSANPNTGPRLPCELQPRDWLIHLLSCEHEGSNSKAPEGTEPWRRYLHQRNLCSVLGAMTDGGAYAALANAANPDDAFQRLERRFLEVPTLPDAERGSCDSIDRV